ncbi:MAG: hypothetical protein ACPGWR_12135 [Ardenticatenaceae bacterium]
MMRIIDALIPKQANNEYHGGSVAFYGFCLIVVTFLFKSTVHFLTPDSGVNSIASIILFEGDPDPNNVVYMFSAIMGLTQMMWTIMFGVVLWRYRSLIPLMLGFTLLERLFGLVVGWMHPLTPEYFAHTPPGKAGEIPGLLVSLLLLSLALYNTVQYQNGQTKETSM